MASNEWLVRKLHEQDKKIEALSRGGTGVGHTSIAPGENLTVISDNGEVVLGAGGVEHVDGPTPATPSAPTLKLGFGTIETTWDGTFAEGEDDDGVPLTAPVDFDVVEVHCSTDPEEEEWGEDTMRGQIKTREGGTITVGGFDVDDEVFVCLIALAKTGKRSAPSATASLVIEGLDFSQLFNELDAANATIKNAGEILVTEQGTLDEKLTEVDGTLDNLGQDLAAVEDAQAQLNTDLTDVMTSVDGKNTITWNPSAPSKVSNPGKAVGDLWYRTSGNSVIGFWKWDGTDWITQLLDKTTIPLIDIGAGTFGSLSGARLEAGTVAASSIAVGDFSNLATIDPVRNVNVTRPENWSTETVGDYITPKSTSQNYLMFKDRTNTVPFKAGDQLRVEFKGVSDVNGSALIRLWGYPALADGTTSGLVGVSGDSFSFTTTEQSFSGKVTIPASFGASTTLRSWIIGLGPQGGLDLHGVRVRDVRVYRMTDTTLIQNGAVSTGKLAADVLEVKNLKATTGQLDEAVINKLFSDVVVAKMAVAEEFIGENAILTGAVTAPKITASEELWAKIGEFVRIRAEHIEADAIDGMVITGPNIRTAATGARVQMDPNGVRVFNGDNDVRTHLSPDGSTFKGEVEADTLVVNEGAEFKGNNTLAQGAKFTLAAGVTDPTAPPTVQPYWDSLEFTPTEGRQYYGLAWAGGKYWTFEDDPTPAGNDFLVSIDPATGELGSFIPMTDNFWAAGGVTAIGSELFMLGRKTGVNYKYFVRVYSTTGTFLREWEYAEVGWSPSNPLKYRPGIGNDGTNIVIAHCYDTGQLAMRTYNKSTGSQIGATVSDGGDSTKSDITGVYVGNADWGRKLATVAKKSTGKLPSFSPTTGVYDSAAGQFYAATSNSVGVVYVDGKFRTLDPSGVIHEYANNNTGDNSGDWWAAYRWYKYVGGFPLVAFVSRISSATRFSWPRRAKLKIMGQPLPVGVPTIEPVLAKKTATPGRTDFRVVPAQMRAGTSATWYDSLPADWLNKAVPTESNTFPEAESSVLESASGTFQIKGDGSGHWGPLTFNADGSVMGVPLVATGEVTVGDIEGNGGFQQITVTLPEGKFSTPPAVTFATKSPRISPSVNSVTSTSFNARLYNFTSGGTGDSSFSWIAAEGS